MKKPYWKNLNDAMHGDFAGRYYGNGKTPSAKRRKRFARLSKLARIAQCGHARRVS